MVTIREMEKQAKEKAFATSDIKCSRCQFKRERSRRNFIFQWTLTFFFFSAPLIIVASLTCTDAFFNLGFIGVLITLLLVILIISGGYLFLLNQEDED